MSGKKGLTWLEMFEEKFIPEPNSGCWLWLCFINPKGYGMFAVDFGSRPAHQISYELYKGNIPEGKEVDHLCRVKSCVNPDHLEAVTHQENSKRIYDTVCRKGHYHQPGSFRIERDRKTCLTCEQIRTEKRQKNKEYEV